MLTRHLLPVIDHVAAYKKAFNENAIWEPAIRHLVSQHALEGEPRRGAWGSHVVYRAGDVWIKLMTPLFAQDMIYEIAGLKSLEGLSIRVPQILAKGELEGWPYVLLSNVAGERIGDSYASLNEATQAHLAGEIGRVTRELQRCVPDSVIRGRVEWNHFIRGRLRDARRHHEAKGLPKPWLDKLAPFLASFEEAEFLTESPVFLHSDLTSDHFLIDPDAARVTGVIDFADCRVGHPEYDIPASTAYIFKGNRTALRSYLQGMGFLPEVMIPRLSEKLLAWTILHGFSDLQNCFKAEMSETPDGEFSALARSVYPL